MTLLFPDYRGVCRWLRRGVPLPVAGVGFSTVKRSLCRQVGFSAHPITM